MAEAQVMIQVIGKIGPSEWGNLWFRGTARLGNTHLGKL